MKKYAIILAMFISACSTTPNSHFYQLQPTKGDVSLSNRKISVGVEEVGVPKYIDRPQIVIVQKDSSELNVSEFHRWAEPLTSSITRILSDDLSFYLPQALIKPKTYSMEQFNYAVNIEVNKFDAVFNDKANLDAWWTIYRNDKIVARGRTTIALPVGNTYDNIVEVQSSLINEMAKQIASKLSKL